MHARRRPAAWFVPPDDGWPWLVCAANLAHVWAFAQGYPLHRFDPDLLAYLVYYRHWLSGDTSLHGSSYFMHPKTLLVFGLGPLGSATAAFYVTAVASAALGTLVYLVARDHFGRTTALLVSAVLLLDPSKAFLTLRSSADLYLALFLFAAIWAADCRRDVLGALCLLAAALVKPVALPCAAYFLTVEDAGRRRWIAAALPLAAVPLTLWSTHALLGGATATAHFFEEFTALRGGDSVGADGVLHFALWTQLVHERFATTAAWGIVGLLLWLAGDRRTLTSPLLLIPLLFVLGYTALAAVSPFMPFFRFFWPLEVWFLLFVVYGAVEGARRLAAEWRWAQVAIAGFVLVLLANGSIERQLDYRRTVALVFERSMAFAATAEPFLQSGQRSGGTVLVPLALLPYVLWTSPQAARPERIDTAERVAMDRRAVDAEWILYTPELYASAAAREWIPHLIEAGRYDVRVSEGPSALLARVAPGDVATAPLPVARR